MKGLIGIILVIVILYLVSLGIITYTFSSSSISLSISAKETKILNSVDYLESVKDQLPCLVSEVFNKTILLLAKNGGYLSIPNSVPKGPSGPYWRVYDQVYIPDYRKNLVKGIRKTLEDYFSLATNFGFGFSGPMIIMTEEKSPIGRLNFSNGKLIFKSNFYTIYDKTNISVPADYSLLRLFDFVSKRIIKHDKIKEALINSINSVVSVKRNCVEYDTTDVCKKDINKKAEEYFNSNCKTILDDIKNSIEKNVQNFQLKIDGLKVSHKQFYTYANCQPNYTLCGCKDWDKYVETSYQGKNDLDCENYCKNLGYDNGTLNTTDGKCMCRNCLLAYELCKDVKYKYKYYAALKGEINIIAPEVIVIENKKEVCENPVSIIYIKTSSDYKYRPL